MNVLILVIGAVTMSILAIIVKEPSMLSGGLVLFYIGLSVDLKKLKKEKND